MGWSNCGTDSLGRPIGYQFDAECDEPWLGSGSEALELSIRAVEIRNDLRKQVVEAGLEWPTVAIQEAMKQIRENSLSNTRDAFLQTAVKAVIEAGRAGEIEVVHIIMAGCVELYEESYGGKVSLSADLIEHYKKEIEKLRKDN